MNSYLVPRETVRVEQKVKNSRFIATVSRASSVGEAKAFIQSIRDEMPDATHHVYAYKIGCGASVTEGMSDDGEPSGTSGPPVLSVIRGSDVGDIVLVVSRYFGGTKLGTGGLVSAYSDSAKQVMGELRMEEKVELLKVRLSVPYALVEAVKRVLNKYRTKNLDENYGELVMVVFDLPQEELPGIQEEMRDLFQGKENLDILEQESE
ncbi:YigZ family protein [bacterium]|nr:YigZ family protein [bacterium]